MERSRSLTGNATWVQRGCVSIIASCLGELVGRERRRDVVADITHEMSGSPFPGRRGSDAVEGRAQVAHQLSHHRCVFLVGFGERVELRVLFVDRLVDAVYA